MEEGKQIDLKKCCYTTMEKCICSRRCFMTGEYCSKQTNIQREKNALHEKNSIKAFVIMNFSDMSDVVYKWRLRDFVRSLKQYLYMDKDKKRLYCSYQAKETMPKNIRKIDEVQVIRADSDPVSNYVICSRICQQMQIADLIIVDVSAENTNVFYEFGMAVALGKMILPICYSESFYKRDHQLHVKYDSNVEHHIGCYPWRKALFEYYGIHYKNPTKNPRCGQDVQWVTRYLDFEQIIKEEYGFSDIEYNRFPYHEKLDDAGEKIGIEIYNKLKNQYNRLTCEDNTLVVYTIEGFLNEQQAALCIVNFYYNITARMRQEQCFCGERVGVLAQGNYVLDSVKDSPEQRKLAYSVAEVIYLGVNEATYFALEEKVKTEDFLTATFSGKYLVDSKNGKWADILSYVKGHIRNRGMLIYPNYPVYVNRVKNKITGDILDSSGGSGSRYNTFCLYHVMLRTLRYTNEVVIDISNNCLQALFWLGAAHGSDIYAITVLHEETEQERESRQENKNKKVRNIFDVAGLWTAVFHSYDTEGFYWQLALAQVGIERNSRLLSPTKGIYERERRDGGEGRKSTDQEKREEKRILESYYRRHFWNSMHCYNRLRIYLRHLDRVSPEDDEPRRYMVKWDIDAVAELSHYLSKRTVIGEYNFVSLNKDEQDSEAGQLNFICVGEGVYPLGKPLSDYIDEQITKKEEADGGLPKEERRYCSQIHKHSVLECKADCENKKRIYKGFEGREGKASDFFTQHPQTKCLSCEKFSQRKGRIYRSKRNLKNIDCSLGTSGEHSELAQIILWRDNPENPQGESHFRTGIIGASGPATYALAMLFVDEEQREKCFGKREDGKQDQYLLCELQAEIRKKFMEVFIGRLHDELEKKDFRRNQGGELKNDGKKRYLALVEYTVSLYLSSVLYRYFLPLLSENDIRRIYNGMHIFIATMKASGERPFALSYESEKDVRFATRVSNKNIEEVAEMIPKLLRSVLWRFRGVEAFYRVEVKPKHSEGEGGTIKKDTRSVRKIEMLVLQKKPAINCIFGKEDGKNDL